MKYRLALALAAITLAEANAPASAALLFDSGSMSLSSSDPTQIGRLSRGGIRQSWLGDESYPGEINTSSSYLYRTFDIAIADTPYIQISFDSGPDIFGSAYLDSYDPTAQANNWLGDSGFTGLGQLFQVIVPAGHQLVILVNATSPLTAADTFNFLVEGYIDTNFTDPPANATHVPEPITLSLLSVGVAGALAMRRRMRSSSRSEVLLLLPDARDQDID